jgi:hypothetical protein
MFTIVAGAACAPVLPCAFGTLFACSTTAMQMDLCLIFPSAAAAAAVAALSTPPSTLPLQLNKAKDKILDRGA